MQEIVNPSPARRPSRTSPRTRHHAPEELAVRAYHLFEELPPSVTQALLGNRIVQSSLREVQASLGDYRHLFVFRFGCLVFVNVDTPTIERTLASFKEALSKVKSDTCSESFEIRITKKMHVDSCFVELPRFQFASIRIVALIVAQSTALEYFENRTQTMLERSNAYIKDLSLKGRVPFKDKQLLKIIGQTAATRQEVLSHLAVLDTPEETWENKQLEGLFEALEHNFEIHIRSRVMEKKLSLIQDNIELLADLVSTKRSHLLELLIILLIGLEILIWSF